MTGISGQPGVSVGVAYPTEPPKYLGRCPELGRWVICRRCHATAALTRDATINYSERAPELVVGCHEWLSKHMGECSWEYSPQQHAPLVHFCLKIGVGKEEKSTTKIPIAGVASNYFLCESSVRAHSQIIKISNG